MGVRARSGEFRGSDEGGLVPELLTGRHHFVAVMAVAITRRVGTHNLWEFPEPIDEVDQSLNGFGWVVNLLVLGVAEAAKYGYFLFWRDLKKNNRPLKIMKIKI
jgi:hypothetical protein